MAASNTETVVYDTWTGGDFGTLAPDLAEPGMWTGTNVVVYRDGHIGPRPGLRAANVQNMPNGSVDGFGFIPTPDLDMISHWIIQGDEVWVFRPDYINGYKTSTDLAAAIASDDPFVWWKESTRQLGGIAWVATSSGLYTIDPDNGSTTLTKVTAGPDGWDVETYKERLLVSSDDINPRIFYSDAADYETWPVEGYFDAGFSWDVTMMIQYRDSLLLFTPDGVWLLTGGAPTTYVLRRISEALHPQRASVVRTNDDVFYVPAVRSAPVAFDGTYGDEETLAHLENWKPRTAVTAGIQSYENRDVIFVGEGGQMLWRKNMVWTKHQFTDDEIGPYITRHFDSEALIMKDGTASTAPSFFFLDMDLDRPAFVSDLYANPGDNGNTPHNAWFRLPDYFSEQGKDIRVRQVIVDFTKYDTAAPNGNNFNIRVDALARFGLPGSGTSTAEYQWFEEGSEATTAGVRDRCVANLGQSGWAGGYRLALEDLRGVKIDRILVQIETRPGTPRG